MPKLAELQSTELKTVAKKISTLHKKALTSAIRTVEYSVAIGDELRKIKPEVKTFTQWVDENLPFKRQTAYRYMAVSEAVEQKKIDLTQVGSVVEALRLTNSGLYTQKVERDPRRESFISHAIKIERWIASEIKDAPVEKWPQERRDIVKEHLKGLVAFYESL